MKDLLDLLFKYFIPLAVAYFLAVQIDEYIGNFANSITESIGGAFVIWVFSAGSIYAGAYYATRWLFVKIGLIDDWG